MKMFKDHYHQHKENNNIMYGPYTYKTTTTTNMCIHFKFVKLVNM